MRKHQFPPASHSLILALLLLCLALPAFADSPNRQVKAGIFNFNGYHMKDEEGNLSGYGVELLNLLSEYSHLNFALTGYEKSWQDMLNMLRNGEIDLVTSARRTPEREEIFAFSLPVGNNHTLLSTRFDNYDIFPGDYSTYNGMTVGGVRGSSQNRHLEDFAKAKGFTCTLKEFDDPQSLTNALQNGEVDAIISSNLRKPDNETVLDIIHMDHFYAMARKEDQAIIDEINYAIQQMHLNEGDWQNDLYYRYYGPEFSGAHDFTNREKDYISEAQAGRKTITAIARPNAPPYSYVEDGKLKGILPDYFDRIMGAAGQPYKLLAPKDNEDYHKKVESNEAQVVLDKTTQAAPSDKGELLGFTTDPYMITGQAQVMRVGFTGPVKHVALPRAAPIRPNSILLKNMRVSHYDSPEEAMRAVRDGKADAAYVLPYTAQVFVNADPDNSLYYSMLNNRGANMRMYVPAGADHELISILNKSIKTAPEGTLNHISAKYISVNAGSMTALQYLRAHPAMTIMLALLAALTAFIFLFMLFRGRINRRVLAATEQSNKDLASQLAIVEALTRNYSNVFSIDPQKETARSIKLNAKIPKGVIPDSEEEWPYDRVLGSYVAMRVHPDDREYAARAFSLAAIKDKLRDRDEYTGTCRIINDGKTHYFQFTFVHVPGAQGKNQILAGVRNIDDLIARERKQKRALAEALAQARYASSAKTAFLNNMSHDIRTPMNAIIGFTALASENVANAPMVRRYLEKIMTSGNHLLSLINDVLDMSRIESGKVKIEEKEASLPAILHDLRTIAQSDIKAKQLDFHIDTLNVINETIFCDKLRVNQVLLNILSNAMKYTPAGGSVSVRMIQLGEAKDGFAQYQFRIKDNGIGMTKEFLKNVFEPFEREQTSTVSGIQGTGLGLAITKNIVDMMGGNISVTSEPGKGSEFVVVFRFRVAENAENEKELAQITGMRALVVDDDVNTCTSVGKMLSVLNLRPDWTTLGREALVRASFAMEQGDPYQFYFVDWMMADMNGIELARRLRKIVLANVPIIIMTAYDWTDAEEEGREAGVTAFCSKPVFLSELRKLLLNPTAGEKPQAPEPARDFAGRRILLAEDNEMNQEIAQMILEKAGFKLDIVENGAEAVQKMRSQPADTYDLILMDVQMPVMNGYDATRAIRNLDDPARASIPIIAMTANAFDEDRQVAMESGMNGYVAKPIDIKMLMQALEEILLAPAE